MVLVFNTLSVVISIAGIIAFSREDIEVGLLLVILGTMYAFGADIYEMKRKGE